MNILLCTVMIGIGATVTMDIWGVVRERWLGIPRPDYGLVGRWVGHMTHGRFRHPSIKVADAIRGERLLGGAVHYLTGIAFAGLLLAGWGMDWVTHPTPEPALLVGIGTVAAPFLLMQPGMGAGLAARRTPNPVAARQQSLVTHGVFGLGLYLSGWLVHGLLLP
ncbi:MAG: DUF2938 domain-containing protein [Moraxellaceae bacterium]|nr:DUF2938 domain-containing protein [Moraxellaceae bacterium]